MTDRSEITIRRANVDDVPVFGSIINNAAEYGLMLHRSLAYLYEHVREFHVAADGDDVVGVCGLSIVWGNLAEIYALAVSPSHQGRRIGGELVKACIEDSRNLGVRRLMALTYEQPFFERLGFTVVDRQELPLKVWSQCVRCSKNQACDEIAVIYVNKDVPDVAAPQRASPPTEGYVVPVVLNVSRPTASTGKPREKMDEAPE